MKKKFKIGDKVKVVKKYDRNLQSYYVDDVVSESGTVTNTRGPRGSYFVALSAGRGYYFNPRSLELVPEKSPQIPLPIKREFKIGDTVRICRISWKVWWSEQMDATIGTTGKIIKSEFKNTDYIHVKFDKKYGRQDRWYYHADDIEHVEEVKPKVKEVSLVETVEQLKRTIATKDQIISTLENQIKRIREIVQIEL